MSSTWEVASSICALIANCHCKKKYKPRDFNPTLRKSQTLTAEEAREWIKNKLG